MHDFRYKNANQLHLQVTLKTTRTLTASREYKIILTTKKSVYIFSKTKQLSTTLKTQHECFKQPLYSSFMEKVLNLLKLDIGTYNTP